MRYEELSIPASLSGWVAALWTLAVEDDPASWHSHVATPDGCVELIRRTAGQSEWHRPQPPIFITGLSAHPIDFRFSGDARFVGVRMWPWTWAALGGTPCPTFADDWTSVDDPNLAGLLVDPIAMLVARLGEPPPIARMIGHAANPGDLAAMLGWSARRLQRWFATYVGLPPRSYLRLLRFGGAMRHLQRDAVPLAQLAVEGGYADQAHMNRDFSKLAGVAPGIARRRAHGPFL